ncbi:hypothetical protein B0A49_01578 [Cryomyces minteri]|uniref:Methyltransferase domain-containing protein n=1 Tax=Cryomyces minteri TaxID=331657 RepID=A0A4U0XQR9_9PEZI|nr:hypothetical protein B0A49_01578 [Cryomyces minteri]
MVLPQAWREWFKTQDIMETLELLMRTDLSQFDVSALSQHERGEESVEKTPREQSSPPPGLLQYIRDVRMHLLKRDLAAAEDSSPQALARHVAVGMNVKKIHEVSHFARFIDKLTANIADSQDRRITHLVDFGSGQNYLGRALASRPYDKHVVAIESRPHNIEGAKFYDVTAKLAVKEQVLRNKKEYRAEMEAANKKASFKRKTALQIHEDADKFIAHIESGRAIVQPFVEGRGSIQYVEHRIEDGNLESVIKQIVPNLDTAAKAYANSVGTQQLDPLLKGKPLTADRDTELRLMVISLHSCGNLVHHGIRSLLQNPSVQSVALVGCCYNLMTERLGPASYKLPTLRPNHPRLVETSTACDPHGFPMSDRLCNYKTSNKEEGIRLNITARMMAVQAPQNWGEKDSEAFFKRHFFRALLQRIFLDYGVVDAPKVDDDNGSGQKNSTGNSGTQPLIIGSLRKSCYDSFTSYVRGAIAKLSTQDSERGVLIQQRLSSVGDADIQDYEHRYQERKKELSIMWSLMAFSAGVIEAVVVVDRYLFLKEQPEVRAAWVEPVFEYTQSPRNLVVVGVKR